MRYRCPTFTVVCVLAIMSQTAVCQQLEVSPQRGIAFNADADSTRLIPSFPSVSIVASDNSNLPFRFAGLSSYPFGDFLVVSPPTGVTPATVSLGLNPNVVPYLPSGNYVTLVYFANPGQSCPPCAATTVLLHVRAAPRPSIRSVVSAASLKASPIVPWQVVSIFGENLGTPPVSSQFDTGGLYPTSLGNSTVRFNDVEGALLYVSTNQINAMVPSGVVGHRSVEVVVIHNQAESPPFTVDVSETAPGIYTATQNGSGQGAIINNGVTFNSEDNPIAKGGIISLFGTGGGLWRASFPERSIFLSGQISSLIAPVSVTIGGQPATIRYAGGAPYQVLGTFQVNAVVPDGIGSGRQPVVLKIGERDNADQNVTVAVK